MSGGFYMVRKKIIEFSDERLDDNDDEIIDDSDPMAYIDCSSSEVASFNFTSDAALLGKPMIEQPKPQVETTIQTAVKATSHENLFDNRTCRSKAFGITPPVEGEYSNVKCTFVFRQSTVRMLNRLKAEHVDENVYLSSIVDEALRFYYGHVFEEKEMA